VYGDECITAVIYVEPEPTEIVPQTPQDDARIEALYARINEVEAQRAADTVKTEKAAKRANLAAQRANQVQMSAPVDDGSTRRAMAREAYQKALKGEE